MDKPNASHTLFTMHFCSPGSRGLELQSAQRPSETTHFSNKDKECVKSRWFRHQNREFWGIILRPQQFFTKHISSFVPSPAPRRPKQRIVLWPGNATKTPSPTPLCFWEGKRNGNIRWKKSQKSQNWYWKPLKLVFDSNLQPSSEEITHKTSQQCTKASAG